MLSLSHFRSFYCSFSVFVEHFFASLTYGCVCVCVFISLSQFPTEIGIKTILHPSIDIAIKSSPQNDALISFMAFCAFCRFLYFYLDSFSFSFFLSPFLGSCLPMCMSSNINRMSCKTYHCVYISMQLIVNNKANDSKSQVEQFLSHT